MCEDQFWKMRPITYRALVDALGELNSADDTDSSSSKSNNNKPVTTTIDKIPGW